MWNQPTTDFVGRHGSLEAAFMALTLGHLDHVAPDHRPADAPTAPSLDRSTR